MEFEIEASEETGASSTGADEWANTPIMFCLKEKDDFNDF
jgi:hypothetical protein